MTEKKNYRVTAKAPLRIAGKRVAEGDILIYTEAEAVYERELGWIVEVTETALPASPKKKKEGGEPWPE